MQEPFFIVGPTAVGKTEIAVRAAELCGAEIVGADASQVYAGLAHLTAKPTGAQLERVPHHLIGHVAPTETYHVARYHGEATACLLAAASRARPVIVVGGSGLYVKALTHGLSPLPAARPELRAELEAATLADLVARLATLDPATAGTIDSANKRRVLRALEVCILTGKRFSDQRTAWDVPRAPVGGVFFVREKQDLAERIAGRTTNLLAAEALEETRLALQSPRSETAAKIIGLSEISAFLSGKVSRSECVARIQIATRRYAKRQLTWFRGESFEQVINLSTETDLEVCARAIAAKINGARTQCFPTSDKRVES